MTVNILQKVSETSPASLCGLPEGWGLVTLLDVCEINPPKASPDTLPPDAPVTFVPMPAVDAEQGAITKPETRPFGKVRKGYTSFREGDVIMAKITPCMENGKAAIARNLQNGLGFGSTEFHVFRSNGAILADFLYHFIRQESFRKPAEHEMTGSVGQKRVPVSFLEQVEIPLPPLPEQKRVVVKIEELLAQVNATRERLAKVPAILRRFRQAVLAAACSGRLTEDWRPINSDFEPAEVRLARACRARLAEYEKLCSVAAESRGRKPRRPSNLEPEIRHIEFDFQIPKGWFWASIEDIASIRQHALSSGPFGSVLGTKDYRESGIPVIRGQNIQEGNFVSKNLTYLSNEKAATLSRSTAYPGDIVVVAVGTSGQAAIVPDNLPRSILSQNCNKITVDESLVIPEFILLSLRNDIAKDQLTERTTDTARPFLSLTNLKKTVIAIPSLDEQREIVRKSKALLKIADAVDNRLNAAWEYREKLAQSMLVRAFRGELVPTEAEIARGEGRSYESAGELLRRIR